MPLNKDEALKVGYRAKIDWYKKRMYDITEEKVTVETYLKDQNPDFETQNHTPDELISILDDLQKKASKLEDKITYLSTGIKIPIDKDKLSEISDAVAELDSASNGEYIDYALYNNLLREQEYAYNNIDLNYLLGTTTGDVNADSVIVHDKIFQNFADYNGKIASDNSLERYANRWLNNAVSWNEHEYKIRQILNFADNYLDINPDPSFIPWKMRRNVGEERIDAKSLSDLWKYFSANYTAKVQNMVDGASQLVALKPDPKIQDITTRQIVYTNNFLNKVNDIFDINWAVDLVCCFMQWGIRLDLKTLKGLRALLQLIQTGLYLDFRDILNGIKDVINNIFRGLLCHQLVGFVKYTLQNLVDPIKAWLNEPDSNWNKIFACSPIDELINKFVVESIDYLERLLVNLIQNWYKKMELKNIRNNLKLELMSNQKWAGELAKLLDSIIAVIERAAQCGISSSPIGEEVQRVFSDYKIGDDTVYQFPSEENPTIYNSFISTNPEQMNENSASASQTVSSTNSDVGSGARVNQRRSLNECLKKIPPEIVTGVKEWANT